MEEHIPDCRAIPAGFCQIIRIAVAQTIVGEPAAEILRRKIRLMNGRIPAVLQIENAAILRHRLLYRIEVFRTVEIAIEILGRIEVLHLDAVYIAAAS